MRFLQISTQNRHALLVADCGIAKGFFSLDFEFVHVYQRDKSQSVEK